MLVFDRQAVEESAEMSRCIGLVEDCFGLVESDAIRQMNPHTFRLDRPDSQYGYGLLATYQAVVEPYDVGGVKWLGEYLRNSARDLPNSAAVNVLSDTETALPLAILDGGPVTELRTAAGAAVGATYLARPDSSTLAIVGCGRQGRAHLDAMREQFDLSRVYAYDHHEENRRRFARAFGDALDVRAVDSPRAAVVDADIVCTVSTADEPVVDAEWLPAGCHVAATAGFKDLDPACSRLADAWYLGWRGRDENWIDGDEQGTYGPETLSLGDVDGDLAELVREDRHGRRRRDDRTLLTHMGMPALDVVVSNHVYERGRETGSGDPLSLFDCDRDDLPA